VKNLLSLRDAEVPLRPFTVFVEPNSAGKSNLFRVLREIGGPSSWVDRLATWGEPDAVVELELETSEPVSKYELAAHKDGRVLRESLVAANGVVFKRKGVQVDVTAPASRTSVPERALALRELAGYSAVKDLALLMQTLRVYEFDPTLLRQPVTIVRTLDLGERGNNLPAVLDTLREEHPDSFDALEQALRATIPGFKKLALQTFSPGTKSIGFHEEGTGLTTASSASDGTLLLLALLTLAHVPEPPAVVCLEEPERGVHPRRLAELASYLWSVVERGTQVLVATHSPYFLDCFRDRKDSVVVVDRDAAGSRFRRVTDLGLRPEELEAPLGEIWYSGVLGGVPAA
jgi:predicted ATPase